MKIKITEVLSPQVCHLNVHENRRIRRNNFTPYALPPPLYNIYQAQYRLEKKESEF
jgi:hypothetical protein